MRTRKHFRKALLRCCTQKVICLIFTFAVFPSTILSAQDSLISPLCPSPILICEVALIWQFWIYSPFECHIPGNSEILEEIQQNMDFSYVRILKMMYAQDDMVRLLAGAALAAFAFNSLQNQKDIAEQGGIRFSCYVPFLQSEDEYFRCQAAFQVCIYIVFLESDYMVYLGYNI